MTISISGDMIVLQKNGSNHEFRFEMDGGCAKVRVPMHILCLLDFVGIRELTALLRQEKGAVDVSVSFD